MKKPFAFLRRQGAKADPFIEWPFFLLLTFACGFIYVESIITNPAVREPARLVPFTVLMSIHVALHWYSVRQRTWRRISVYLVIQGLLAFVVTYLGGNLGPLLGLYLGLVGESIGLLREKPRWTIFTVVALLGLSFINYDLLEKGTGWYWWLLAMAPMTFFVVVYVTLYSQQVEARARAQKLLKELESANRQLSEYAAQVEDLTLANERQRMARELHDTLSQGLAGLILQLEAVDAHLAGQRVERGRTILQQSMEKARLALTEARQAIDDLRQPAAGDLAENIRQEAERFAVATGIPCEPQITLVANIPELVADTAARAVSEGLTNIARHAQAKNVTLRLASTSKELEIVIKDDGVGFDPAAVEAGHYGLLGMRERVRLAGGRVEIYSRSEKGTRLVIRFPLNNDAQVVGSSNKL